MVLVANSFCHSAALSFVSLSAECEMLAVDFCLPGCLPFSLVNVYFPHGVSYRGSLDAALASCKNKVVLAGDFNSHHVSWGCRTDASGKRLWEWASDNNLFCHNSGNVTFISGQARSVLDLTFAKPGLVAAWSTLDGATSSDHVPVLFELLCTAKIVTRQIHSFVDMNRFGEELRAALSSVSVIEEDRRADEVVSLLQGSVSRSKFTVSSVSDNQCSPWWDEECKRDFRRRKAAWKKLFIKPMPSELE